ncbi:YcdB/YcdC domain-containing protein [Brevibacillus laterosporus]|uniref:YcdB/YcdC domain-containing protein n=1 Tax=Brevibacillus laterosporus TaxID=1465 RepID=UPI003D253216
MDVDSFDKKLAQEFRTTNLDVLPFTPQLEAKIWEGIRKKKQKNRRLFASLSLACGFTLIVLGSRSVWLEDIQLSSKQPIIKLETELKGLSLEAQKTMQSLYKFAPYLKNGKVMEFKDARDNYIVTIEEKKTEKEEEGWSARIRLDRTNGKLEELDVLNAGRDKGNKAIDSQSATAILQEFLGEKRKEYKQTYLSKSSANFMRYVNGIPVNGDNVYISVNGKGELEGFGVRSNEWIDQSAFPHPSQAIPIHELENQLQKYIKLRYVEHFDPKNDRPILEYTPGILNAYSFDAITGKTIYHTYYDYDQPTLIKMNPPNKPALARNQQEAELLIKQEYGIKGPLKVYSNNWDDHKQRKEENEAVYQFGEKGEYTVITELSSGRVLQISKVTLKEKWRISKEKAREKAIRFLEKYLDPWDKEVQLTYSNENEYTHIFRFFKSHQGIPVLQTDSSYLSYSVQVDSATGEVILFIKDSFEKPFVSSSIKQVKLPDRNAIVSPKVGASEWLRYNPVELVYEYVDGGKKTRLVYRVKERKVDKNVFIDATTGKAVFVDR